MIGVLLRNTLLCSAAMTIGFVLPAAATGKTVVSLDGTHGEDVFASMTLGSDGNLYGTTVFGGANGNGGTVFRLTPKGKYTVLYNFCSQSNCTDGANGEWLTQGSDGNFYGQTYTGGNANDGTIFEITPSGQFTSLYSFCSQAACTDGANPQSAFVQASDGSFWGTTISGGANDKGTVFKFVPGSAPQIMYSFCAQASCTDGSFPFTGLTLANDGNFYGVTAEGGNNGVNCGLTGYGCGTVFRITPGGSLTTLHTFCTQSSCMDGAIPQGQMIQAKDGDLYGTADVGGVLQFGGNGQGTVFKISLGGKLKTVYAFCPTDNCTDGIGPESGVIQAADGTFYGTALIGGPDGWGNVFRLTGKGKLTSVYSVNQTDGADIAAGVVQASNGKLYGGAKGGGNTKCNGGCGVIFDASLKGGKASVFDYPSGHVGTVPATMQRPAFPVTPLSALQR
jgi:uncharacterized repeat protein (TIGR03803 family)